MKKMSFEKAFSELEILVEKMENKDTTLEESVKMCEKANNLIKFCEEELNNAEQKIKIIE